MRFPRPRKRTLLMALLLLTGGAIINIAVAWEIAYTVNCDNHLGRDGSSAGWALSRSNAFGTVVLFSTRSEQIGPAPGCAPESLIPYGSFLAQPSSEWLNGELDTEFQFFDCRGWPMLSVYCDLGSWSVRKDSVRLAAPLSWAYDTGIQRIQHDATYPGSTIVLPLRPILPGFAINTIFYTAILWLLVAAPGFVRRRIRIKRGRCPACAYPVGTSAVCTECGAHLPSPSR